MSLLRVLKRHGRSIDGLTETDADAFATRRFRDQARPVCDPVEVARARERAKVTDGESTTSEWASSVWPAYDNAILAVQLSRAFEDRARPSFPPRLAPTTIP